MDFDKLIKSRLFSTFKPAFSTESCLFTIVVSMEVPYYYRSIQRMGLLVGSTGIFRSPCPLAALGLVVLLLVGIPLEACFILEL